MRDRFAHPRGTVRVRERDKEREGERGRVGGDSEGERARGGEREAKGLHWGSRAHGLGLERRKRRWRVVLHLVNLVGSVVQKAQERERGLA